MKIVYRTIEPYGFEQIIIDDHENIPEGCTEIVPPVPNWKPKFDFEKNQWSELATAEEKKGTAIDDTNEIAKLNQQVTDLQIAMTEIYESGGVQNG